MTRPTYETEEDRAREDAVSLGLAMWSNAEIRETPKYYPYDRVALRDGKVVALIEIKCRKARKDAYRSLMISAHKVLDLRRNAVDMGVPGLLAVSWICGAVGIIDVTKVDPERFTVKGRTDRGDSDDVEPVAELAISDFKIVSFKVEETS